MRNRKNIIRKIALSAVLLVLLTLTLAFLSSNSNIIPKQEAIEAFYGRAIFGGKFAWLDNVKRPGLTSSFAQIGSPLAFDFSLSSASPKTFVDPSADFNLIASMTMPNFAPGYGGPFDGQPDLSSLVQIEQVHTGPAPVYFGSGDNGSSHGGTVVAFIPDEPVIIPDQEEPTDEDDNGDNPPVVPVPGSISLALIGIFALAKARKSLKS